MFEVERAERLILECPSAIADMFTLSPYVWREGDEYHAMLRVVPDCPDAADKIARIHCAHSKDGLSFRIDPEPVLVPGPAPDDLHGCEDPTVLIHQGRYLVYYTGWNEEMKVGRLLLAEGPATDRLQKCGVVLASMEDRRNPKEATVVLAPDGRWRLFYECAANDASMIGLASSSAPDGPWRVQPPPFDCRDGQWDGWHLSTGPLFEDERGPVMFYNGATRDAHWRIGWILFSPDYERVIDRCEEPLVVPEIEQGSDWSNVAFSSSCLTNGNRVWLYYSVADRALMRATLRRC